MVSHVVTESGRDARMVSMNNTLSASQRQAASRAKKKSAGYVRLTLRFDSKTASRLRRIAKSNETTQAQVIEVALVLLDNKQLLREVRAWAAARRSHYAQGCPAPSSGAREGNAK
jgi:hypothetical protein